MGFRRRLAFAVCPDLKDEVAALYDGNTKCVLKNGRLMDELEGCRAASNNWKRQFFDMVRQRNEAQGRKPRDASQQPAAPSQS